MRFQASVKATPSPITSREYGRSSEIGPPYEPAIRGCKLFYFSALPPSLIAEVTLRTPATEPLSRKPELYTHPTLCCAGPTQRTKRPGQGSIGGAVETTTSLSCLRVVPLEPPSQSIQDGTRVHRGLVVHGQFHISACLHRVPPVAAAASVHPRCFCCCRCQHSDPNPRLQHPNYTAAPSMPRRSSR